MHDPGQRFNTDTIFGFLTAQMSKQQVMTLAIEPSLIFDQTDNALDQQYADLSLIHI